MRSREQSLAVFVLSPEMLRRAQESSEILEQYLKEHGSASLRLGGAGDKEIVLPDSILRLVYEALSSAAAGKSCG
jgi:hypothetical protein